MFVPPVRFGGSKAVIVVISIGTRPDAIQNDTYAGSIDMLFD
jgi:hypothetical protein